MTELSGDIAFAIDHIGKQERLHYFAYYDVVTVLANRSVCSTTGSRKACRPVVESND